MNHMINTEYHCGKDSTDKPKYDHIPMKSNKQALYEQLTHLSACCNCYYKICFNKWTKQETKSAVILSRGFLSW